MTVDTAQLLAILRNLRDVLTDAWSRTLLTAIIAAVGGDADEAAAFERQRAALSSNRERRMLRGALQQLAALLKLDPATADAVWPHREDENTE